MAETSVNTNVKNAPSERMNCCSRLELCVAAALGLVWFGLFTAALPQDIVWGDSPELAAAAYRLGNPHPTGYSLYMLLLHAVQWLPVGTVAYRSHLFSAMCMSAACSVWMIVLLRFLSASFRRNDLSALVAASAATIAFALTPTAWSQAIITEVYAFFILLCAVNVVVLQRAWNRPLQCTASMLMILSTQIIHHRLALFLVAMTGLLWIYRCVVVQEKLRPSALQITGKVLLGLSPFLLLLYFPIRASYDPFLNWYNPSDPARFWDYINGSMYQDVLRSGLQHWDTLVNSQTVARHIFISFCAFGLLGFLILFGWGVLIYQQLRLGILCIFLYLIYLLFVMLYKTGDWQVFLLPLLLIQTVPMAFCVMQVFQWIEPRSSMYFIRFGYALFMIFSVIPMFVPDEPQRFDLALSRPVHQQELQKRFALRQDTSAKVFADQVWKIVQAGDSVVTGLDQVTADNEFFPLAYQHVVEGKGDENPLIAANFMRYDWYRSQLNRRYDLDVPMKGNELAPSRQAYLEEIWKTVIHPLLQRGGIVTPSPNLPPDWYARVHIENYEIKMPRAWVSQTYRMYLPKSYVQRLTLKEEQDSKN